MHLSPARRSPLDSARRKKRATSPLRFLPPHRLRSFYDLAQFLAVKGSLSDHLCVATCHFFTFPSSICPNKLHRQRCVFFSSRLFLPRFRIRQPLDYRRGRIEGHPPYLCHLSYIGDRIRFDIAKDARGIFSPFPTCLRKPRFFMQLSQAIDRLNGIRRRLVQSLQEEANHRSCPHAQTSSLQILCVPCSKVEITCPSYP